MQPIGHHKIIIGQAAGNTIAPISAKKTELSTVDYTIMVTFICLPMLFFAGVLGKNAYQQRRARVLKQNIFKLEKAWQASCQEKQDR